jgi:two-component system, NtrC family, sensor histidine kinase HydH
MRTNPFNLSRWFGAVALVSIASISLVSGWLLSGFLTQRMLQQEARLTQEVIDSLVDVEQAAGYFAGSVAHNGEYREFVAHISALPDVLRANLYSRERRMVWSSDPALIGRHFADNDELEAALAGTVVAHGGERAKTEHEALDPRYRYFFEIYTPVRAGATGEVVGVVELYKTPQALFEAIAAGKDAIWIGAALAGLFLYATLFWLVRHADQTIRAQRERLVQSETFAAIGEMSSAVAHGIRNPLASIRSSAELALDSPPADWRDSASDIVEQVDRLESWIRRLLSYSQPLGDKAEPVQVGSLVQASLAGFERELERRHIRATVDIDAPLPPVKADALMLEHVFTSLIANAMEAIERDGSIGVAVQRDGEHGLRVSVRDDGPGMTSKEMQGAFKPFHTSKPKGIGIGLPLARRIVQRFGGSIALASTPGAGTTVDVLLPAT